MVGNIGDFSRSGRARVLSIETFVLGTRYEPSRSLCSGPLKIESGASQLRGWEILAVFMGPCEEEGECCPASGSAEANVLDVPVMWSIPERSRIGKGGC